MNNDLLFNEFMPVTSKQWKQKIQYDLDGADYNKTLIWKTNEDILVKPFYHSDDFTELPESSIPIAIGTKATQWKVCQSIYVADVNKSNLKAIKCIKNGADSIKFIIPNPSISVADLIKNIDTSATPLHFELQFLSESFVIPAEAGIHIHTDIIGNLTRQGNWFRNLNDDFNSFDAIVKATNSFSVDASLYQNAGANMVQQLAYALAHANEYLNRLYPVIASEAKQSATCIFNISVGSNYFFEIAKLRALRILWKTLALQYQFNPNCHIYATPTKRNKTLYDSHNNMLRTTTECMSAILGGADTISNLAYDNIYLKTNEFSARMARNQLLVLKYESYFDKVDNPVDGAYYMETITNQLAEKALELFKDIEVNGGFLKQLKEGTIQRKIKESAEKEQRQFDVGDSVLLGSNLFENPDDKMKDALQLYPFVKTKQRKTLIEPIIEKRLAEGLEQKRLKNEG